MAEQIEDLGSSEIGSNTKQKPKWDPKGKKHLLFIAGVVVAAILILILLPKTAPEIEKPSHIPEVAQTNQPGVQSVDEAQHQARLEAARIEQARKDGKSAVEQVASSPASIDQNVTDIAKPERGYSQPTGLGSGQADQVHNESQSKSESDARAIAGIKDQMITMQKNWGLGAESKTDGVREYTRRIQTSNQSNSSSTQNNMTQGGSGNDTASKVLISAFETVFTAEALNTINSDHQSILRARILTGPLAGAVISGGGKKIEEGVQLNFTTASLNGKVFKISAMGIDEKTSSDIVEGRYDGRYAQRFVFPILAEGVRAYAAARAQTGTTLLAINLPGSTNGGVGVQTPAPNAEQARNAMIAATANSTAQALSKGPTDGLVTIPIKQTFGIVFLDPVYESEVNSNRK